MPMPGFQELKETTKLNHTFSSDVHGDEVVYIRASDGIRRSISVHIEREKDLDLEQSTRLLSDRLRVQVVHCTIGGEPAIGDRMIWRGITYSCQFNSDEGNDWWTRAEFVSERLEARGMPAGGAVRRGGE